MIKRGDAGILVVTFTAAGNAHIAVLFLTLLI
jgi:hypothetical protein